MEKVNMGKEKSAWQEGDHSKRFLHAFRGLRVFLSRTRHLTIYISSSLAVIILGFYFHLSSSEWIAIIFSIGFVMISEAFNTAIEIDINLTSPEYHPYAKDTKDVAAGAVLMAVLVSIIVGSIIFLPKIF